MAENGPSAVPSAANFDTVASMYRWAEYLCHGPLLQRVRLSLLRELAGCRQALVLGDGDGRFLAEFLLRHRPADVLAVDTSAAMLRLLRKRCLKADPSMSSRLRTRRCSALAITPSRDTDLVVSHFFLDCLSPAELERLTQHFAHHLTPGTLWLVSDFAVPSSPWLNYAGGVYIRALYLTFRVLTGLRVLHLPPISDAFHAAGFRRLRRREFAAGMLYSEVWQLGTPLDPPAHNLAPEISHPKGLVQTPLTDRPAHNDAQPDPEPPVPSLPGPDAGVFHHTPAAAPQVPGSKGSDTSKAGA